MSNMQDEFRAVVECRHGMWPVAKSACMSNKEGQKKACFQYALIMLACCVLPCPIMPPS